MNEDVWSEEWFENEESEYDYMQREYESAINEDCKHLSSEDALERALARVME